MRVLFLTHRLPYAPNRGDRVRAFHIIRTLAPRVDLEIVSLVHDAEELSQTPVVERLGARVTALPVTRGRNYASAVVGLMSTRPLTHLLLDTPRFVPTLRAILAERRPDIVLAYCSGIARFALMPPLAGIPLVMDFVDVDTRKWTDLAAQSRGYMRWLYAREARCLEHFERRAAMTAHASVVVNDRERDALRALAPEANVRVVRNGVDVAALQSGRNAVTADAPAVVFCGVMNYAPNVDAVLWFARYVWPTVRARRPDAQFIVVGSSPTPAIQQLTSSDAGIEVTGAVDDVRPFLWRAAVSVAPLMTARGVQNKVLEALAAGLPAVITPQVLEGLPAEAHAGCRVASTPSECANQTVALLAMTSTERRALAARADLGSLTWESQLAALPGILTAAARPA